MKRVIVPLMVSLVVMALGASAQAITCPVGQHAVCHGGSGRGGGYRSTCTCVNNPPPTCVTAWGTQIPAGTSVILYDAYAVNAPDTCSAHGTLVACSFDPTTNVLTLTPDITGYTVCNVIYDTNDD
jgi:hypothetical protein